MIPGRQYERPYGPPPETEGPASCDLCSRGHDARSCEMEDGVWNVCGLCEEEAEERGDQIQPIED